jgi:hypothetical protein
VIPDRLSGQHAAPRCAKNDPGNDFRPISTLL